MVYMAMARKWRPMSFADLVGQEHIASTFKNAIEGGRLHHAFLFTGTRGVGKTTSARILARSLNCSGGDPLSPCGTSTTCKDIAAGNPMDVIEIEAASHTSVDDMRDIIEQVKYTPMIGKYKVFVIDEVHMLSKSAFNALLNTLEAPPDHVIFIFATTEVGKVPQTILSRVQRFDFKRLNNKSISDRLAYICEQEEITASLTALDLIAQKADGSMRDALTYFDQIYAFSGQNIDEDAVRNILGIPPEDLYFDLIEALWEHQLDKVYGVIAQATASGLDLSVFLQGFAQFLRNVLFAKVSGLDHQALEVSEDLFQRYREAVPQATHGDLLRYGKIANDTLQQMRYSTNPRLSLETALARMAWLDRVSDLRKILTTVQSATSSAENKKKYNEALVPAEVTTPEPKPDLASEPTLRPEANLTPEQFSAPELSSTPEPDLAPVPDSAPTLDPNSDPYMEAPPEADDFSIDFDDVSVPSPQIPRFEIVSQWKRVVQDFYNSEPLVGAYLEETTLQRGDYQASPFELKIIFKHSQNFQYEQITKSPNYKNTLTEFLQNILGGDILLRYELLDPTPEELAELNAPKPSFSQPKPNLYWEKDLKEEAILQQLSQAFDLQHITSKLKNNHSQN